MPWPFGNKKRKGSSYDSLPSLTEDRTTITTDDAELPPGVIDMTMEPDSSPVTVTLGAQDRYKKLLERGPEKPGWKRVLGAAAISFANQLGSRGPLVDQRTEQGMIDEITGKRKYADELARAEAEAETERKQKQLKAEEDWRKEATQQRRDAANAAAEARKSASDTAAEEKRVRTREMEGASLSRSGYRPMVEGEPVPANWEKFVSSATGTTYIRPPQAEREGWQSLPTPVIEHYKAKRQTLPSGPIDPKTYNEYVDLYRIDKQSEGKKEDQRIREAGLDAQDRREKNRYSWLQEREEQRARRTEERAEGRKRSEMDKALNREENALTLADRALQEKYIKSYGARTREEALRKLWSDSAFISERQKLLNQFVDRKNQISRDFGSEAAYPYLDPKTGKPVGESSPSASGKETATKAQMESYIRAQVAKGFPEAEARRKFLESFEVK